jgi:hypothetical protein
MTVSTLKQARAIAGTLGKPSKMPGMAYGLPAASATWVPEVCKQRGLPIPPQMGCPIGSKLAQCKGTVCNVCYAWFFAHEERMPTKIEIKQLEIDANHDVAFFRWHDSGDILGAWHLALIIQVCELTPYLHHWLPTRETATVVKYKGAIPSNLVIRHSAHRVDAPAPKRVRNTSTVSSGSDYTCPAPRQDDMCLTCRKCWTATVANTSYHIQ